ncbi:uncharacterized protein PG986_006106 [Apiospora aurea]|uniref:Heterokaryon incompatibility domain-containing protein n=1 Tax=Apiospora aurea TaxID=335848 RepID=A0ABR1QJH0_9PEZI
MPTTTSYKPIAADEFRVVHILPTDDADAEVRCLLETRSPRLKTHYEALSYQWGDDRATERLSIPIPAPLRQTITRRYDALLFSLRALAWAAGTAALWHLISPLPVGPSDTLTRLRMPRDAHLLIVCAVNGFGLVEYPVKAIQLLAEVWRTKPWRLAYRFRVGGGGDGGYLRFCRKKKEEEEKSRGGEIRAAFQFIKSQSGFPYRYFTQSMPNRDERFEEARPGLIEMAKRGWWERLWVLQEVALATGPVQIQCGGSTCKLEQFMSAHVQVTEEYCKEGQQDGEDVVSLKEAPAGPPGEAVGRYVVKRYPEDHAGHVEAVGLLSRATVRGPASAHPPADRGKVSVRDDRDRLYAILGIAGGVTIGETNRLASFMDFISKFSTGAVIARSIDDVLKASPPSSLGGWLPTACTALVLAHTIWDMFYESEAKHWTINRPDYVVTEYEDIIGAIADVPNRQGSAEFFTELARLLAHATKSLAFLDAVAFEEETGGRDGMPSWVPNWAREIEDAAYKHSIRVRGDDAQDLFHFLDGGKTLQLVGRPVGRVKAVKSLGHAMLRSLPQSFVSEKYLALPQEGKDVVARALTCAVMIASHRSTDSIEQEGLKEVVSLLFKCIQDCLDLGASFLLVNDVSSIVHIHGKNRRSELGFLRAGEARFGDSIVFVPGCFSHLVLRRTRQVQAEEGEVRWILVGLVKVGSGKTREPCLQSEWERLVKDKSVYRYAIV